jgi:hypothetical protein
LGVAVGRGAVPVTPALVTVLAATALSLAVLLRVPVYEESAQDREGVSVETPELASYVA